MTVVGAPLPAPPPRDVEAFLLPFNLEAERSTLGAALVYSDHADYVVERLTPEAFHRRAHQALFEGIRDLRRSGVVVDFITLKERFNAKTLLEIGGPAYIASLTDGMPHGVNVAYYCDILKDLQAKRELIFFADRTLNHVAAGDHSAEALIADADRRLMDLQRGHAGGRLSSVRDSLGELMTDLDWRVEHRGELLGLDTGFASINDLTHGWCRSDLIIGAARPSMGKTTFVVNTAAHVASLGKRVAIFSLEMRKKQILNRLLSSLSGVELTRIFSGHLGDKDYQAIGPAFQRMHDLQIEIDDRSGQSVWDIRSACRRMKGEGALDLVIIDYVQLMPGSLSRKGATRNDEVTDISRRLKVMADELDAPVILLSQLSRAAKERKDKRPILEDLRESGALEQDADLVWFLYRQHHHASGTTEWILRKARNGPTGTVHLTIHRDTVLFTDGGEPEPEPAEDKPRRRKKDKSAQADLPVEDADHS